MRTTGSLSVDDRQVYQAHVEANSQFHSTPNVGYMPDLDMLSQDVPMEIDEPVEHQANSLDMTDSVTREDEIESEGLAHPANGQVVP